MPKYYAVRNGRNPGIYSNWDDCKEQTSGYSNAKYKSFGSVEEANQYISGSNDNSSSSYSGSDYCDTSSGSHSGYSTSGDRCVIYTDGACSNNGYGGAKAGIGVHFPDNPHNDISEPLRGRQTNNRAEIHAAKRALEEAKKRGYKRVEINTDSQFLHNSVNQWINKWEKTDWKTSDGRDVINKEDFLQLKEASKGMDIQWRKVAAHKGVPGNEEADRLANKGIEK